MKKNELIEQLSARLSGLPSDDIENMVDYYSEMIDERIEDGIDEEEAVAAIGDLDEIVSQILSEIPISKLVKAKVNQKSKLSALQITLIIMGAPLWIPILIAILAVIFSVFVAIFSLVISAFSVVVSFGGVALGGILGALVYIFIGMNINAVVLFGIGVFSAGATILSFILSLEFAKLVIKLIKKTFIWIKFSFIRKGEQE